MKAWKCCSCGATFDAPILVPDGQPLEVWGAKVWKDDSYEGCPECDSWDIESRALCEGCEDAEPAEGDDYCAACRRRIEVEEKTDCNWLRPQAW